MKNLLLSAAAFALFSGAAPAQSAETIHMLAPTWLGFAPVHVANDMGLLQSRGA